MSLEMQAKLLRILETGELRHVGGRKTIRVDVRIVSATHRDLRKRVASGEFREDLFYRLNVLRLELPPLRQRAEDIPRLCAHFLQRTALRNGLPIKELTAGAMDRLARHPFPGNVRELSNIIERACALEPGPVIDGAKLHLDAVSTHPVNSAAQASPDFHKTFEFNGVALNRRQSRLLEHLKTATAVAVTNREYCQLVTVSERTGLRDLTHLVKNGVLTRIGKRKGARYQLNA